MFTKGNTVDRKRTSSHADGHVFEPDIYNKQSLEPDEGEGKEAGHTL